MYFRKLASSFAMVVLLSALCLGQTVGTAVDAEKQKAQKEIDEKIVQILDQVIADAAYLRLPQNKALVFALAGDLYWKFDDKRSRDLFRTAANEILAYNLETERERRESTDTFNIDPLDFSSPRYQILPMIAQNDADLALELLLQTRPTALAEAMLRAGTPDANPAPAVGFIPEMQRVKQETDLEQRIALMAADSNPDRAIKMIRDSLAKGVSYNVVPLLEKVHKKDEKKAAELGAEVIRKLVDSDLAKRADEMQVAVNFLLYMSRTATPRPDDKTKPFKFTDTQTRDLAAKVVSGFLQPGTLPPGLANSFSRAIPILEKIAPDKVPLLRQKQAEMQRTARAGSVNLATMNKLRDPNTPLEEILAEVPRIQNPIERTNTYRAAAARISMVEDEARAKKLIDQIGDEKVKAAATEQYEAAKISRAAAAGRLDEARRLIGGLANKRTQVQKYVSIAQIYHRKGSEEDIETAKDLMKSAYSLISVSPEDEDEMNNFMEVVRGYAVVEPDTAFRMFEPVVEQMNEVVQAYAVLSKYNKRDRNFKKGELVLRMGNSYDGILLFRYLDQVQLLGKADLARMNTLSDRFQRPDARTMAKLMLLQGAVKRSNRPQGAPPPPVPVAIGN